jgi:hypothetical protein
MPRFAILAPLALAAGAALAQPLPDPESANRAVNPYVYMMDGAGHKVLVSTNFWRNDPKYDDRAFHRFIEVLAALEKKGFRKSEKATIDSWDKPSPLARCYVYLEDLHGGRATKTSVTAGARVWCSSAGISEIEVKPADTPKHVAEVLQKFDMMFDKSRKALGK